MGFMVADPGTAFPRAASGPKPALPPLGKTWKTETSPGVREVTKAVTADGEWLFERAPDGTWMTGHLPTKTELKGARRSLRACRLYAAAGQALADLKLTQAHERESDGGKHEYP